MTPSVTNRKRSEGCLLGALGADVAKHAAIVALRSLLAGGALLRGVADVATVVALQRTSIARPRLLLPVISTLLPGLLRKAVPARASAAALAPLRPAIQKLDP